VLSENSPVKDSEENEERDQFYDEAEEEEPTSKKVARKTIFDKWAEKFKDFLDNAE